MNKKSDSIEQPNSRADRIEEARSLGLQGYYDGAFEMLEDLLKEIPTDIESLRLKGNLLELKAMELLEISRKKFTTSADYLAARQCYELILEISPQDVKALIDLGEHYAN